MINKKIYLSSPHMNGTEMGYIKEAFETNWVAPLGKNVEMLEKEMTEYLGRKEGVALASGTSAIHLGLKYLGVGDGDTVFCSSFTFSASANPIVYLNAKPVFIDSDYETYNMSSKALTKAFEYYPHPKAIVVVNLYGHMPNYDEICRIAKEHNVPILEDSAESLGSMYHGKQSANFGDISIISFNGNKIITTSGGGMLLCNDLETKKKVLFWATQSREPFPWYQHEEIGFNYRLSNISAGIGRGQLKTINDRVEKKRQINKVYKEELSSVPDINFVPVLENTKPNFWLTVITLSKTSKIKPMDIFKKLEEYNIESRPAWKPMHLQPFYAKCDFISELESGSVCEDLFNRSICLPSDTHMTDGDVKFVASVIKEMFK